MTAKKKRLTTGEARRIIWCMLRNSLIGASLTYRSGDEDCWIAKDEDTGETRHQSDQETIAKAVDRLIGQLQPKTIAPVPRRKTSKR